MIVATMAILVGALLGIGLVALLLGAVIDDSGDYWHR